MADGKKKFLYDLFIDHVCWIGATFSGQFNPSTANPYRMIEVEALKTDRDRELESKVGFDILGNYLKKLAKKKI